MAKLTPKQLAFVREYQVDYNGTQAAIRAGYSENTARHQAYRLLVNDHIRAEIDQRRDKREERVNIEVDVIVAQLYAGSQKFLGSDDPASFNAGVNGVNRLAKMQGWDAPEKRESGKPGEFEAMTNEERDAKIEELNERLKKPEEETHEQCD